MSKTIPQWNEEDEKSLFMMRRDGLPYSLIGASIGRTEEACKQKYNKTRWQDRPWYSKIDELRENIYQDKKSILRERIVQANERKLARTRIQSDILADAIGNSIKALPKVKPPIYTAKKKSKQKHEAEDVGLMLSDMHIGHNHTYEETGGLSQYNCEVYIKRVEILKASVVDIAELHGHLYDLPNLHIFCLGDVVSGMNAVGQWSNTFIDTDIMTQWTEGVRSLADMIYYWLGVFEKIYFYGVAGNHGRIAPLGIEKHGANWDVLSYKMLELMFANNSQVEFFVPNTWWIKQEIRGHKFLIVHGDDIRGASGTAIRGLQNFVDKWASIANFIPNYTLAGHFHSAAELATAQGKILLNGSFVGPDVYSLKTCHSSSRPEQKLFGIHNRRGITWTYSIDLKED